MITINQNDLSNGVIGFSQDSLTVSANEDTGGVVTLKLARTEAFFGEVQVRILCYFPCYCLTKALNQNLQFTDYARLE